MGEYFKVVSKISSTNMNIKKSHNDYRETIEHKIEIQREKMYQSYQEAKDLQEIVGISQELDRLLNQLNHSTSSK